MPIETVTRRTTYGQTADEEQGFPRIPTTSSPTPYSSQNDVTRLDEKGRSNSMNLSMADRFLRTGKRKVGVVESLKAILFSSWLNILIVFIPIAWVAHFSNQAEEQKHWAYTSTFVMCFLAIIPLEKLFEYGGEQMTFYLGQDLGELLVITLNNTVEATLAIILLKKCELKLLQSTVIGVVVLHLLLIPGVAFVTGGARISEQDLHPHITQLNQTLLTIGVMTLLLPAAFFAALNNGILTTAAAAATGEGASTPAGEVARRAAEVAEPFISDHTRHIFLQMSRGLAVILLLVYIGSRIFLHNPPGGIKDLAQHKLAPEALKDRAEEFENEEPEVNQWVCIVMLIITIGIMAATAEWLVDSIEFVREDHGIQQEWFGLILLPLVSFSGDGCLHIIFFVRSAIRHLRGQSSPPAALADARPIDLSIQFTMFWMPFLVLLGWWIGHPMTLLFDLFEVALVIASCFIVNYVTADAKTNWAEGFAMLSFYFMIALCSWFYAGQQEIRVLVQCKSVVEFLAGGSAE